MNRLKINTAPSVTSTTDSDIGTLMTPSTTTADNPSTEMDDLPDEHPVCDPKTLVGQKPGALLAVKRTPTLGSYDSSPEVGDLLVVTKHYNHYCDATNIRTQNTQTVLWEIFFPLTIGEKCCCPGGDCRCEVEDPEGFYAYRLALAGLGSFPPRVSPLESRQRERSKPILANDPRTLEGQTVGTILVVKRQMPSFSAAGYVDVEAGDHVEILRGSPQTSYVIEVKNLRTGGVGWLDWAALFAK